MSEPTREGVAATPRERFEIERMEDGSWYARRCPEPRLAEIASVEERLDRIERAVAAMAWWLVAAQTGFAKRDAEAVTAILRGERE